MADHALRLGDGVWRIPTAPFSGTNSFAFVDGDGRVTLVDCGMSFAPPRIVAGLAAMGRDPKDVTRIVLTHTHVDQPGGAVRPRRAPGARPARRRRIGAPRRAASLRSQPHRRPAHGAHRWAEELSA